MTELFKFAYHIAGKLECNNCEESFQYSGLKFQPSQDNYELEAEYQCPSCSMNYDIFVEDIGHGVSIEVFRDDQEPDSDHPTISKFSHKASLHEELHQARDLVEGIFELDSALSILEVNKKRITESVEELRQPQGFHTSDEFDRKLEADIHNYLAAAYSFEQVLSTVEGELPTDGPVETALESFEDEHRVISGLRTFVQHYLTLPTSYSHYLNENTGDCRVSVIFNVEDVNVIESDVDRYPPDGYAQGAEYHYGQIDLELIDIDLQVQSHFNAAEGLVSSVINHAADVRGDDLQEYAEQTDYISYFDN